MFALLIILMLPIFITLSFTPYWTRKTDSFGVTIPESAFEETEIRQLRRNYVIVMSCISIIFIIVLFIINPSLHDDPSILISLSIATYIIISFIAYLYFHFQMKRFKETRNWAKEKSQLLVIDTTFHHKKLTYSNGWFIFAFIIVISTFLFTLMKYDQLPAQIPMQYNFSGEVTNWANKSYRAALMMPIMQLYMIVIFIFVNTIIGKAKQQVSAVNPKESAMKNIIFRKRWSAFTIIAGISTVALLSFVQFAIIFSLKPTLISIIIMVYTFGIIIACIILSITTGQGGSRISSITTESGEVIDRDDDNYWKLGQFYFNKNDPSIFLEKRFGIGWTANLARPMTWLLLILIIGTAIAIPLLLS